MTQRVTQADPQPPPTEAPAGGEVIAVDFRLRQIIDARKANLALVEERKRLFPSLDSKIAYIQCALPAIGKNARNEDDGWTYAPIDQIVAALKEIQEPLGLLVSFTPLVERTTEKIVTMASGRPALYVRVALEMRVKDLDSGEMIVHVAEGDSWDPNGKALNQALTFARRNAIVTEFNVVTSDEVAGEGDRRSHPVGAVPQQARNAAVPATSAAPSAPPQAAPRAAEAPPATAASANDAVAALEAQIAAEDPEIAALFADDAPAVPPTTSTPAEAAAPTAAAAQAFSAAEAEAVRETEMAQRAALVGTIMALLPRKGKTTADANAYLRRCANNPQESVGTAASVLLERVRARLDRLPDHVIPFGQGSQ